jgi:Rad3-related DNA helicase
MVDIRGHGNYRCANPEAGKYDPTCSLPREQCLYLADVERAKNAPIVVSNFAYWMSLGKYGNPLILGDFDLLIIDEAHTAPEWLADFCTITLNASDVRSLIGATLPLSSLDNVDEWSAWAAEAREIALRKHREVKDWPTSNSSRAIRLQQITELGKDLATLAEVVESDVKWVAQKVNRGAKFSPVWAHAYAERYMFRGIKKVILCSATLPPDIINYLGITKDDSSYLEVDSGFDPSRRPFIWVPTARVSNVPGKMSEVETRVLLSNMDQAIDTRLSRRGIIHSGSYVRSKDIVNRSRHAAHMVTHYNSDGLPAALEKYLSSPPPCILVSPSVGEGHDFKDDAARWQIIFKVPFIDSRDPVTKARIKDDKLYGNFVASVSLTQRYGRVVRSMVDWGETLIFDSHWGWFRNSVRFADWFKRAWRVSSTVPPAMEEPGEWDGRKRSIREMRGRG